MKKQRTLILLKVPVTGTGSTWDLSVPSPEFVIKLLQRMDAFETKQPTDDL